MLINAGYRHPLTYLSNLGKKKNPYCQWYSVGSSTRGQERFAAVSIWLLEKPAEFKCDANKCEGSGKWQWTFALGVKDSSVKSLYTKLDV